MIENSEFIHITKCAGTSIRHAFNIEKMGHNPVRRNNDVDEDTFVYSFVRNPWDRMASFYRWHWKRNAMRIRSDGISFQDWFYLVFVEQDRVYHYNDSYFKPCHWWLEDEEGNMRADFVGRVENIEEDFAKLCEILDKNVILEKLNSTEPRSEYYTPDMEYWMRGIFKKDFDLWYSNLANDV